ncbi:MAG: hypothetical protein AAF800_08055 [Planctomycetota bacterium]
MSGSIVFYVVSAVAVTLLAVGVLVRGWRGVRIDDHPICRRCGYDLHGGAGGVTCAECGGRLDAPRALRRGNRRRSGRTLLIGGLLLFSGLCLSAGAGNTWWGAADWITRKPTFWLRYDAIRQIGTPQEPNAIQLAERLGQRRLSVAQEATLVEPALRLQGNPSLAWAEPWPEILETLMVRGHLSSPQLERLARQSFDTQLTVRPVLRRGDSLRIDLDSALRRTTPNAQWDMTQVASAWTLAGVEVVAAGGFEQARTGLAGSFRGGYAASFSLGRKLEAAPLGPATMRSQLDLTMTLTAPVPADPVAFTIDLSAPVEVAAADTVVDEFAIDPAVTDAVDAAWTATRVESAGRGGSVWLRFDPPPASLAMAVWLEQAGREPRRVGRVHVPAGTPAGWREVRFRRGPGPAAGEATVRLEPDQAAVAHVPTLASYWGGELTRRGIVVDAPYRPPLNLDASLGPAVERAVYLDRIALTKSRQGQNLSMSVQARSAPVRLDYVVRVDFGDGWIDAPDHQNLQARAGNDTGYGSGRWAVVPPGVTRADIMLVPNLKWEDHSPDPTPPWGHGLLFEDVVLIRSGDNTTRTGPVFGRVVLLEGGVPAD